MWRQGKEGEKGKLLADLMLQKVEMIFCWMLFQLSTRSRSLLFPLLHKHTSCCMCPSKCFANIPQALKPLKAFQTTFAAALQLNQGAVMK